MPQNQSQSLLEALKENKLSDQELLQICSSEIENIKQNLQDLPSDIVKENILEHLLKREKKERGKNIFDYCAIHNKVDLFKKIISEVPAKIDYLRFNDKYLISPLTYAVVHNSNQFLKHLLDSEFKIFDMVSDRNIFHLLNFDNKFFNSKSVYEFSQEELSKKVETAKLLLDKADGSFLGISNIQNRTALQELYRHNPPEFIIHFTSLMRDKGVKFDLNGQEKAGEIFHQLLDDKPTNSQKIELVKLIGDEELERDLLQKLFYKRCRKFFEKKDSNQKSLFEIMQEDPRTYEYLNVLLNISNSEIWTKVQLQGNSQDFVKDLDIETILDKDSDGKSLWQFIAKGGDDGLLKLVIDKIDDVRLVKKAKDSLTEPTITAYLAFGPSSPSQEISDNLDISIANVAKAIKALDDKEKSLTPNFISRCFSCLCLGQVVRGGNNL